MCFSATASFVTGGALGATGILTLKQARTARETRFASIPLLFGIQQAIEGVVWISFGSQLINMVATYAYSFFSHVLWPVFVPYSILLIEDIPVRKKMLRAFFGVGLAVGAYLLYFIVSDPVIAKIVSNSIAYQSPHLYPRVVMSFYLLATCGSCFVSSHKIINFLGIVLLMSFGIAGWFFFETFFSVWCFFAAILSAIIYLYFRSTHSTLNMPHNTTI